MCNTDRFSLRTPTCHQGLNNVGYFSTFGDYYPAGPLAPICCGIRHPGYLALGGMGCWIEKNLSEPETRTALARLTMHNPVLLVACTGDLAQFSTSSGRIRSQPADKVAASEHEMVTGTPRR